MFQFYINEVRKYPNGEYEHEVHFAYDEDGTIAQLKAESKYHEVMANAAASVADGRTSMYSAILFSAEGFPLMHGCYKNSGPEG